VGERFEPQNLKLFDPAAQRVISGFTCKTPHTTELLIDELRKTETAKYELQGEQRLLTVVAACGQRKMLRVP
jgi:hypothetical protein